MIKYCLVLILLTISLSTPSYGGQFTRISNITNDSIASTPNVIPPCLDDEDFEYVFTADDDLPPDAEDANQNSKGDAKKDEKSAPTKEESNKFKSLKIAFLSSRLDLDVDQSQKFWPVYNKYVEEIKEAAAEKDEIVKDEKVLTVRKKYKEEFEKYIPADKVNTLFKAEKEFKRLVQEELLKKRLKRQQE